MTSSRRVLCWAVKPPVCIRAGRPVLGAGRFFLVTPATHGSARCRQPGRVSDIMVNPGRATATTLYRIVQSNPPTISDFLSGQAKGVQPRSEALRWLWDGISLFNTAAQARRQALRFPLLGRYLAQLSLPPAAPIRYERTLSTRGHYTVWGNPAYLLRCVTEVMPV